MIYLNRDNLIKTQHGMLPEVFREVGSKVGLFRRTPQPVIVVL